MSLTQSISHIQADLQERHCTLVAVTKTHPVPLLQEAYEAGLRTFGENKVQEMTAKYEQLPKDIQWHQIGHLQSNKVKYIAPFVALIHSVDSLSLLQEINKQAAKHQRVIPCLLQVYIASEETKFGLDATEVTELLSSEQLKSLQNVSIKGLMGMASNTSDTTLIRREFRGLKSLFDTLKIKFPSLNILSMGMSSDYAIALEEGSNMVRIGSALFGQR